MPKANIFSLSISILILLSSMAIAVEETLTIATYYPAPYGVYNEMRANKVVIGEPNAVLTPSPDTDGVVIFKGRSSNPTGINDLREGAVYYNDDSAVRNFRYYNGTAWTSMGFSDCTIKEVDTNAQSGSAYCDSGYRLISGGCDLYGGTSLDEDLLDSYPIESSGNFGWKCVASGGGRKVKIRLYCCR